jgi:hypothetical protein
LKSLLKKNIPSKNIWNMDETGFEPQGSETETGYMDGITMAKYVKWLCSTGLPKSRPQLILLDGYFAHEDLRAIELAAKNDVHITFTFNRLPPTT